MSNNKKKKKKKKKINVSFAGFVANHSGSN